MSLFSMFRKTSAALCFCWIAATAPGIARADHALRDINVTYVQAPLNIPSIIEKEKRTFAEHFKKHDLGVKYANLTSGPQQTAALISGDLQFLNAVGGTSVILAAANRADVKIINMYSRSPRAFMMFSRDPAINSPASLKGKTIAGPKGTNLHELLVSYLKKGGLTMNDVHFVSMGIPAALSALESGAADVALQAGANAYHCIKSGKHLVTTGEGLTAALIVTATSQKFYDANKDLVETFEKAGKDVLRFMHEHPAETLQITAKATGLSEEAVADMAPLYDFSSEVSEKDRADFEKTIRFLLDNGMIETPVAVEDLFLKR